MITFLKGLIVGIGGIAPGLSGSVLLVIFGLYQKLLMQLQHCLKILKKYFVFNSIMFGIWNWGNNF
ncbi:MAG: undecaprenyl phosphate translocase family protein [Thomasclavelia sp.]